MNTTFTQPRHRDEPLAMSEAIAGAFGEPDLEVYLAEHEAEERANPEHTNPLGVCRHCKAVLPSKVIPMGRFGFLPNVCCDACADRGIADLAAKERQAQDARFASLVPAEFLHWDDAKGNKALQAAVNGRFSFTSRMGLVLHGPTGGCKTRLMWALVKRIAEQPENFTWLFLDVFECSTKGFPAEADRVDFLFLDDLGNEPAGTKWETSLLHLIRRRCDWHKPIFVSTQLTGAQFQGRYFNGAAAAAILRRLRDRATFIATDGTIAR